MTQPTMETLEAGGFDGIIREGADAFRGDGNPRPCFVHDKDAGGWCERTATVEAFGIGFCEVHGAEVKSGIRAEVYGDAAEALEGFARDDYSTMNPAAWVAMHTGRGELARRRDAADEEQAAALVQAYPVIEGRVDPETLARDFRAPHANEDPVYVFMGARMHVLRLMRLTYSVGQDWLLEVLEEERQGASAQLAFTLALCAEQTGRPLWPETASR